MLRNYFKPFLWSLFVFVFFSCKEPTEDDRPLEDLVEVVILHTNDEHAKIEPFSKLNKLIERERSLNQNLILVSAGDFFSGNPYVDYADEPGAPMIELMNLVGYDLAVIGNHDFDYGLDILNLRISEANFPMILANVKPNEFLTDVKPYKEFYFEDLDISLAFVGFIQTGANGLPSTRPDNLGSLEFIPAEKASEDLIDLKNKNNALIGLTHLGLNNDLAFVRQASNLDLIIGGHSHTQIPNGKYENGILITQAGDNLKFVGKTVLGFRNGKLVSTRNRLISLENFHESDQGLEELIQSFLSNPILENVVVELEKPISGLFQLGCLMTDALKFGLDVDIAFQNVGGIRLQELSSGPVRISDVLTLDPFRNNVVIMELNKEEIINLIKTRTANTGLIDLLPSGLQYTVNRDGHGNYLGLDLKLENGDPLDPNKKYRVAMNSFIGTTYNFQRQDQGEILYAQTTDLLIQYLQESENLDYSDCMRVALN